MNLKDYFESKKGLSVLSTADSLGRVNSAVYSRPHVVNDTEVAFIMADRKSHENIKVSPHAAYHFKEEGAGYAGKRLSLTMTREEEDSEIIDSLRRKDYADLHSADKKRYLVYFTVDEELPLIGKDE